MLLTGGEAILGLAFVGLLIVVANTFLELVFIHSVAAVGFARVCFVTTFTLCGTLFAALLLELVGLLPRSAGAAVLGACVNALVVACIWLLPYVTVQSVTTYIIKSSLFRRLTSAAVVLALWLAVAAMCNPCASSDDTQFGLRDTLSSCAGLLDGVTARASFVGVFAVSALGGYAIVATPYSYIEPLVRWRAVTAAEQMVQSLQQRQLHIMRMWASRRNALAVATGTASRTIPNSSTGLLSRLKNALQDSGGSSAELAVECQGYAQVSTAVFIYTQQACERSAHTANIRSAKGAIFGVYGVILSAYCAAKLFFTAMNLLLGRFSTVDPVTRTLNLVGLLGGDVHQVTRSASLETLAIVFNAVMILSAIRGFLLLIFRLTCHNRAITAEASLLALSTFMGLYFLGLAVLMRLALPSELRPQLIGALGDLPFRYYHWFHDVGMLTSASITVLTLRSSYHGVEEGSADS